MIRKCNPCDIEQVIRIWLNANIDAHPFVPEEYWKSHYAAVREQLLQAEVYVYETDAAIRGFAGLQRDYLAGIFVEKAFRSMGIGEKLLNHIKKIHSSLSLHVYQKNRRAVRFYARTGFSIVSEDIDADTGEAEYTMAWCRCACQTPCTHVGGKTEKHPTRPQRK